MFEINVGDISWFNGVRDDKNDLCAHGNVIVKIGNEKFEYYCTVSAAAMYMLKSLTEDHIVNNGLQFLPCCGFFMVQDPNKPDNVVIIGCSNGIDWTLLHKGDNVVIVTSSGVETVIPLKQYAEQIFSFADKVEEFYKCSSPKCFFDKTTEENYNLFWKEWDNRRHFLNIE